MFDIAWTEYLLIAVVALVLLGPKELPVVLRTLGRWVAKAKQMTSNLEHQLYSLDDNPKIPFSNKNTDSTVTLFTYQKVFFRQHQSVPQILVPTSKLTPKPWL